jgi:hypothetical protein
MPELIWFDLTPWLYDRTSDSEVALAEARPTASHERLMRRLPGDWSGPTLLEAGLCTVFAWVRDISSLMRPRPRSQRPAAAPPRRRAA